MPKVIKPVSGRARICARTVKTLEPMVLTTVMIMAEAITNTLTEIVEVTPIPGKNTHPQDVQTDKKNILQRTHHFKPTERPGQV